MNILIADDHDLFRDGMILLLQGMDVSHITEAANRMQVEAHLKNPIPPDILLLDLAMPGIGSTLAVQELCGISPSTAIMIVSGNDDPQVIQSCIQAGAMGFLPKSSSSDCMRTAIQAIYSGEMYIPSIPKSTPYINLSHRQKEILNLIIQAQSNKEIAYVLGISESTVKQHITELLRKLEVSSRTQIIQKASIFQKNII